MTKLMPWYVARITRSIVESCMLPLTFTTEMYSTWLDAFVRKPKPHLYVVR